MSVNAWALLNVPISIYELANSRFAPKCYLVGWMQFVSPYANCKVELCSDHKSKRKSTQEI